MHTSHKPNMKCIKRTLKHFAWKHIKSNSYPQIPSLRGRPILESILGINRWDHLPGFRKFCAQEGMVGVQRPWVPPLPATLPCVLHRNYSYSSGHPPPHVREGLGRKALQTNTQFRSRAINRQHGCHWMWQTGYKPFEKHFWQGDQEKMQLCWRGKSACGMYRSCPGSIIYLASCRKKCFHRPSPGSVRGSLPYYYTYHQLPTRAPLCLQLAAQDSTFQNPARAMRESGLNLPQNLGGGIRSEC